MTVRKCWWWWWRWGWWWRWQWQGDTHRCNVEFQYLFPSPVTHRTWWYDDDSGDSDDDDVDYGEPGDCNGDDSSLGQVVLSGHILVPVAKKRLKSKIDEKRLHRAMSKHLVLILVEPGSSSPCFRIHTSSWIKPEWPEARQRKVCKILQADVVLHCSGNRDGQSGWIVKHGRVVEKQMLTHTKCNVRKITTFQFI